MNAETLTIGAEILAGDILDTNSRNLAQALKGLGIPVSRQVTVADDTKAIAEAIREAMTRADVVFVTGGLGPTPDDRTRDGVARGLGVELRLREELVAAMRARYLSYGNRDMPESNLVQVTLPEGSEPIPNPIGTAPGFRIEREGNVLFAVPGIPMEMKRMLDESILPWLADNRPVRALASRVLKTMGIGESELIARFGPVFNALEQVEVAFYPQTPGVNIKITAHEEEADTVRAHMDRAERTVRDHLGSYVYGSDADNLAGVVGDLLVEQGWTVATAESCTGGRIAGYLTSVSGSSRYFDRSVVAYSNEAKVEVLGVPPELIEAHGAVSEEVARAMAEGLRPRSGVDVVMATTGIAGPTGGTPEKPVGLVFSAIASPQGTRTWRSTHPGTRELVVTRTVMTDMNRLRLVLLGER
jgi:nicotinamide-nucleotide amidase